MSHVIIDGTPLREPSPIYLLHHNTHTCVRRCPLERATPMDIYFKQWNRSMHDEARHIALEPWQLKSGKQNSNCLLKQFLSIHAISARYTIWVKSLSATNDEFDPGSGQTLAACLTHASRTSWLLSGRQRVADGWVTRGWPTFRWGIPTRNRWQYRICFSGSKASRFERRLKMSLRLIMLVGGVKAYQGDDQ